VIALSAGATRASEDQNRLTRPAGPSADGATGVTPNNWTLTPAGARVRVGHSPFGMILSPDGRELLVSNNGHAQQSLMRVARDTLSISQTIPYDSPQSVFIGLASTRDGRRVFASGGHNNLIREYRMGGAGLEELVPIVLAPPRGKGFATGIALSPDEKRLYVANHLSGDVAVIDTETRAVTQRIPMGASADPYDTSRFPYQVLPSADGQKLYVSNWKDGTVAVVKVGSLAAPFSVTQVRVGNHPNAMIFSPGGDRLYVVNANSDTVSVLDTATDSVLFDIDVRAYQDAPYGNTPNALAVSPDGGTLYVVNAGTNEVTVVDLQGQANDDDAEHAHKHDRPYRIRGRIPTGWYPTAIVMSPDGRTLYVAASKDAGLGQNAYPPAYIGDQMIGSIAAIPVPDRKTLKHYTRQVEVNNLVARGRNAVRGKDEPGLLKRLPIQHVLYIIKENRTYDQVFGDLPGGNGDPRLLMFDDRSAPNHRRLAREYVLLDNTYCDAEISKDGHEWSTGANVTDYTQKVWPADYSGRGTLINRALIGITNIPGGYLWDAARKAGISYRAYGEYVINGTKYADGSYLPATTRMPALVDHFSPMYRTYDLKHMDMKRAEVWLQEFEEFKRNGNLPQLSIISLPNDHLAGSSPGYPTPAAMMADNDLALGRIVDAVSHSSFWPHTAIFVIEDDTQDGYDHVDSHRTPALLISPYARRGAVDGTHYSTVSMMRTMGVLLGLAPLSQFDAAAITMERSFTARPDFTPYRHTVPAQDLYEMNPPLAALKGEARTLAKRSAALDLAEADVADMREYNEILWKLLKPGLPLPQPATHRNHGVQELLLVSEVKP
jgi:YVTN family beta-propeller protein